MEEMISIKISEYEDYLELKKERNEAIEQVDKNLQALKEGRVYDL